MVCFDYTKKTPCNSVYTAKRFIVKHILRDAGTGGGGEEGQPPPLPFTRRGKGGAKVPIEKS